MEVLADAGYHNPAELAACERDSVTTFIPKPDKSAHTKREGRFCRDAFTFDEARKVYLCPTGEMLAQQGQPSKKNGKKMRLRAALAKHPFGTLKCRAGWTHFLVRGFKKVKGEWALMATGCNFTRVLNIIGQKPFLEYCRKRRKGCENGFGAMFFALLASDAAKTACVVPGNRALAPNPKARPVLDQAIISHTVSEHGNERN